MQDSRSRRNNYGFAETIEHEEMSIFQIMNNIDIFFNERHLMIITDQRSRWGHIKDWLPISWIISSIIA